MKLIGLKIDKNPLTIDFMWKPNKKKRRRSSLSSTL